MLEAKITAIVLAAGESRRMGRQKVLLPYGDTTILGHILQQIGQTAIGETLVVTGHQPDAVRTALAGRPAKAVHNPSYTEGMLSSVRAGLQALPSWTCGVMVFLGDHPQVTPTVIAALISAFEPGRGDLIMPVFEGRRGHPLLFDVSYRDEILGGLNDTGLRGLFRAYPERIIEAPCDDGGILEDLDTPEAYEAALARAREGDAAE